MAAKQLIEERRELFIPEHLCEVAIWLGSRPFQAAELLELGGLRGINDIHVERSLGNVRPDLTVTVDGSPLLIEIACTNFVGPIKLHQLRALGYRALEFDVSDLKSLDFAALAKRLFSKSEKAKWLHHPETSTCEARLRAQLEPEVARVRAAYEREQQDRRAREAKQETARVERWSVQIEASERGDIALQRHLLEVQRAKAFAAMPVDEQRALALNSMGIQGQADPRLFGVRVHGAQRIQAPDDVWQSALFAANIHRCRQHLRPYLTVDYATTWLSQRFVLSGDDGKPQVAVWEYLQHLAKMEILEWIPRSGFLVMVADAQAAIDLADFHEQKGKAMLTWSFREVSIRRRVRLAEAFAMRFGAGDFWRQLTTPESVDSALDPLMLMVEHTAQHIPAAASRRYLIGAGYCGLSPSLHR